MPTKAQIQEMLEMERRHFGEILTEKLDKIEYLEKKIIDLNHERNRLLMNTQTLAKQKVCVGCLQHL